MAIGYKDPIPVQLSNRDAYTLRMALVVALMYAPNNQLIGEARIIAERLLDDTDRSRDKSVELLQ